MWWCPGPPPRRNGNERTNTAAWWISVRREKSIHAANCRESSNF